MMTDKNSSHVNKEILLPSGLWNWIGVKCQKYMEFPKDLQLCASQISFELSGSIEAN
jgi:hypothetical protein